MEAQGIKQLWRTEDWWSVWFGLGLVLLAVGSFWLGGGIRNWAVTPAKWNELRDGLATLSSAWPAYLKLLLLFGGVFSVSVAIMGGSVGRFLPGFLVVFVGSLLVFFLAAWKVMETYNVEAPLLALIAGLVVSNAVKIPAWLRDALRTEYYIKTGIVLLGATLPLTLIFSAGPIAFVQATIVSVCTWLTIFLVATKVFKLEPQVGATLGAAGAVCGVSASIAVGGAVRAKKDHISISIAIVTVWAIIMIFALTFALKRLVPDTLAPGVGGAWVGTSEFADAAGFAVVAELASRFGDAPINAFTLMKVIGRDIWIGIWCLILAVVSVVFWERGEKSRSVGVGVIWQRFPKFVFGFLAASVFMSWVSTRVPAGHVGQVSWRGAYKGVAYSADFSEFKVPAELAARLRVDASAQRLTLAGGMTREELKLLVAATQSNDQVLALNRLFESSSWFEGVLQPEVIKPIKQLRSWAFVLCFLCIGLSTRFADLLTFGLKPFWAFTIGVAVNVPLGFFLSTVVFVDFWRNL